MIPMMTFAPDQMNDFDRWSRQQSEKQAIVSDKQCPWFIGGRGAQTSPNTMVTPDDRFEARSHFRATFWLAESGKALPARG
jgi:hypothetical protein